MDLLQYTNLIGLNAALIFSSFCLSLWLYPQTTKALKRFLVGFVLFSSGALLLQIIPGIFGKLTIQNLSFLTYGLTLLIGIGSWSKLRNIKPQNISLPISWWWLTFVPVGVVLLWRGANAVLQIPIEYDSAAYHVPMIAEWLKNGDLMQVYYTAFAAPIGYYPSNYELLDLWFSLPINSEYLVNLLNIPLFAVLAAVFWSCLRKIGCSKATTIVLSAIAGFMPVFLQQAGIPLVDLFFTITFGLAIYFALEIFSKEQTSSDYLCLGLSLGLFIGTKYLGLVYAAVLIACVGIFIIWQTIRHKQAFCKPVILSAVGIILAGSFFYLRNWLTTGNPLFPVDISIGDWQVFSGYQGAQVNEVLTNTTILYNIKDWTTFKEYLVTFATKTSIMGPILLILPFLNLLLITISGTFRKISKKAQQFTSKQVWSFIALNLVLAILTYLYFSAPYTFRDFTANIRYALPVFLLAIISLGYTCKLMPKLKIPVYIVSFLSFATSLWLIFSGPARVEYTDKVFLDTTSIINFSSIYLLILILCGIFLIILRIAIQQPTKFRWGLLTVSLITATVCSFQFSSFFHEIRPNLNQYWISQYFDTAPNLKNIATAGEWFNKNASSATISYTGFNYHYPLYGPNYQRNVYYTNINECFDCRYYEYRNSANSIRRDPNYQNWLHNLSKNGSEYLVTETEATPQVELHELNWALANPQLFPLEQELGAVSIFKINRDQLLH